MSMLLDLQAVQTFSQLNQLNGCTAERSVRSENICDFVIMNRRNQKGGLLVRSTYSDQEVKICTIWKVMLQSTGCEANVILLHVSEHIQLTSLRNSLVSLALSRPMFEQRHNSSRLTNQWLLNFKASSTFFCAEQYIRIWLRVSRSIFCQILSMESVSSFFFSAQSPSKLSRILLDRGGRVSELYKLINYFLRKGLIVLVKQV